MNRPLSISAPSVETPNKLLNKRWLMYDHASLIPRALQRGDFLIQYRVSFESIEIINTRSGHKDTVVASFAINIDGTKHTVNAVNLGDHNNGRFGTGLEISGLQITEGSSVKVGVSVFNSGAGNTQQVADVGEALASAGADLILPGAGQVLDIVYDVFGHIVFANCEGPCITQRTIVTGATMLAAKGMYSLDGEDHGYDSPAGCRSSDYKYTIEFQPYQTGLGMIVYSPQGIDYNSSWGTQDIGEGTSHISFLPVTMNGDGHTQIVQVYDNGGHLGMIVYGPQADGSYKTIWGAQDIGQGSSNFAFLPVIMNGDGHTQIVQVWDAGGHLGMIVYGPQADGSYKTIWGTQDVGEGTSHISFFPVTMNGDGHTQIVQVYDNGGHLGMIVYGPQADGSYKTIWGTQNIGQGSSNFVFLPVIMNGDGRTQIVQIWDAGGHLGMIVYGPQADGSYKTIWGTQDVGEGTSHISFFPVTMNGDGHTQIVQVYDNGGHLGMIVYGPQADGSYKTIWGTQDIGQGSSNFAFLPVIMNGDSHTQIVQVWDAGDHLGMIVYGPQADGSYQTIWGTQDIGQGTDHFVFLPVTMNGDGHTQIVQVWGNI